MKKRSALLIIILISMVACQAIPEKNSTVIPTPEASSTAVASATSTATTKATEILPTTTPTPTIVYNPDTELEKLYELNYGVVELKTYQPQPYEPQMDDLPIDLATLGNAAVIQGLTTQQKQFLTENGFVIIETGDLQFRDISNNTARYYGQPYYLTTDAAYHGLHVTFDELLASLEAEYMRPVLWQLLQKEYEQVSLYMEQAKGTDIELDVQLTLDYLAVASKLLYPENELDPAMETRIAPQIDQIMAFGGPAGSVLIPDFIDDYGAYRPVGHYAGKPELETYFLAMSWLGRVAFKFQDPDVPGLQASKAPLIMTLALNEASLGGEALYQIWLDLHELIDFMIGPSDDPGPMELSELMNDVYGEEISFADLMDDDKWQQFLSQTDQLPAPQINSTFASFSSAMEQSRDWRFMGQVFTLDGFIFQNLIFDKVGTLQNPRSFPSGLDVAAAFGSQTAYDLQDQYGQTKYENYVEQMQLMQETVSRQPEEQWLNRFYSSWLYAFRPQVEPKGEALPPVMRTNAWTYKDMNSMLGSWAELKHDTILYAKMPMGLGGGGPPSSGPPPAYVEPNPQVFYRLAYAAQLLHFKLYPITQNWDNLGYHEWPSGGEISFYDQYEFLGRLGNRFSELGDIAIKELNHEEVLKDEYYFIYGCITYKECVDHQRDDLDRDGYVSPKPDPIPVIAAVSGSGDYVLEAGVGYLNRIYVAVPLEGKLQIAQGGVFTYYEFTQPSSNRLTDQAWQEMLDNNRAADPKWVSNYIIPGGTTHEETAFRIGDVYIYHSSGDTNEDMPPLLNLREEPSSSSKILDENMGWDYVIIYEGPVINDEGTWWKVTNDWKYNEEISGGGWVLEDQDLFERAYGQ
jgi:hypothetical protein